MSCNLSSLPPGECLSLQFESFTLGPDATQDPRAGMQPRRGWDLRLPVLKSPFIVMRQVWEGCQNCRPTEVSAASPLGRELGRKLRCLVPKPFQMGVAGQGIQGRAVPGSGLSMH